MSPMVADLTPEEMARRMRVFEVGALVRFGARHRRKDARVLDVEVVCLGGASRARSCCSAPRATSPSERPGARAGPLPRPPRDAGGRAHEQWRASEGALPLPRAARQSLVGVYVQLNNEYRFVNEAFAAIFGCTRAQDMLDGRVRAHTLIAPEDREHVNAVSRP